MKKAALWFLLSIACSPGCNRSPAASKSDRGPPANAQTVAVLPPQKLSQRLSHPAAPKVVAIGDLHGDLEATRRALRLAGAIGASDSWSGGDLVVVQTGDVIDRGDDDRAVLDLLERLREEARAVGGALILLSGNHELMNVALDFRYVTEASFSSFPDDRGRVGAFEPGGPYAVMLAERPLMVRVGDTVFAHGGILPKHLAYGLDRMNDEVRAWMLAQRPEAPAIAVADDGPAWTRAYGAEPKAKTCEQLGKVLAALGSKRMVVAHTPQRGGISSACDGRVWRIDVGMSKFYGGQVQVLEIQEGAVSVRREGM